MDDLTLKKLLFKYGISYEQFTSFKKACTIYEEGSDWFLGVILCKDGSMYCVVKTLSGDFGVSTVKSIKKNISKIKKEKMTRLLFFDINGNYEKMTKFTERLGFSVNKSSSLAVMEV